MPGRTSGIYARRPALITRSALEAFEPGTARYWFGPTRTRRTFINALHPLLILKRQFLSETAMPFRNFYSDSTFTMFVSEFRKCFLANHSLIRGVEGRADEGRSSKP